jgi:hypothetical protein
MLNITITCFCALMESPLPLRKRFAIVFPSTRRLLPCTSRPIIEKHPGSPQTIKQHLATIKMLFDYLVISQIVPVNPPAPVKGPTHVVKRGKTPVSSVEDARTLLNSISTEPGVELARTTRAMWVVRRLRRSCKKIALPSRRIYA